MKPIPTPFCNRKMPPPPRAVAPPSELLDAPQDDLFDLAPDWKEHWKGMPEFVCEDLSPWKGITVNFASFSDMQAFAALIGQPVNVQTRSVWYPRAEIDHTAHLWYIDGAPVRHYYEWQKPKSKLFKNFPRELPTSTVAKVVAYESCMELLEEESSAS